jgi:AcrR family transcriptional regulator
MSDSRYHHGDLRAALLVQAGETLRESGVDGLSLRELARAVGVSHGAPRRHFDDRAALLEALAVDGWHRLGDELATAAEAGGRPFAAVLNDVAVTYVRFATNNPALLDLMSASRHLADASDGLRLARDASFVPVTKLVELGQSTGELVTGDLVEVGTVLFAMLSGVATMANNKTIDPLEDEFIVFAVTCLLEGLAPHG